MIKFVIYVSLFIVTVILLLPFRRTSNNKVDKAMAGLGAFFRPLINAAYDVRSLLVNQQELVFEYAQSNNYDQMERLLDKVQQVESSVQQLVNLVDKNGRTPLFVACINASVESAQQLLENRANIKFWNYVDGTCMHIAAKNRDVKMTRLLLRYGGNPFFEDVKGWTALDIVANKKDYFSLKIRELFISKSLGYGILDVKLNVFLNRPYVKCMCLLFYRDSYNDIFNQHPEVLNTPQLTLWINQQTNTLSSKEVNKKVQEGLQIYVAVIPNKPPEDVIVLNEGLNVMPPETTIQSINGGEKIVILLCKKHKVPKKVAQEELRKVHSDYGNTYDPQSRTVAIKIRVNSEDVNFARVLLSSIDLSPPLQLLQKRNHLLDSPHAGQIEEGANEVDVTSPNVQDILIGSNSVTTNQSISHQMSSKIASQASLNVKPGRNSISIQNDSQKTGQSSSQAQQENQALKDKLTSQGSTYGSPSNLQPDQLHNVNGAQQYSTASAPMLPNTTSETHHNTQALQQKLQQQQNPQQQSEGGSSLQGSQYPKVGSVNESDQARINADIAKKIKEGGQQESTTECVVCLDEKVTHAVIHGSRAHVCLGNNCAKSFNPQYGDVPNCPICREPIDQVVQFFT